MDSVRLQILKQVLAVGEINMKCNIIVFVISILLCLVPQLFSETNKDTPIPNSGMQDALDRLIEGSEWKGVGLSKKNRKVRLLGYEENQPLFVETTATVDPVDIVKLASEYVFKEDCELWARAYGLRPTYRPFFDKEALPRPVLRHHPEEMFDVPMRHLGAYAMMHGMFGGRIEDNPVEEGQIRYVLSCLNGELCLPVGTDCFPRAQDGYRSVAFGGEMAKNVMLLYEHTGQEWIKQWAAIAIQSLRKHLPLRQVDNRTVVASGFLEAGITIGAFVKWYELTGDKDSLQFAVYLVDRVCSGTDKINGIDEAFRLSGSFGGIGNGLWEGNTLCWHVHWHTHILPSMVSLGINLIKERQVEKGQQVICQAERIVDWLYDPDRNPDAGSITGWLPEWLFAAAGGNRSSGCEGCITGDILEATTRLATASRLDPSLSHLTKYYDMTERVFRNQMARSIFEVTPAYVATLKESLSRQVEKEMIDASAEEKAKEVERRLQDDIVIAKKMQGRPLGICGFHDWVYHPNSPVLNINMMGCCDDSGVRGSYAVWSNIVTGNEDETLVNFAINRKHFLVDVISCLPHRGEINVKVNTSRKVLIRVPEWTQKDKTKMYINKTPIPLQWEGQYAVFDGISPGQKLTITYPLQINEIREWINGIEYTEKWRGNTVVDISPPAKWIPMYQRSKLDTELLP